MAPGGAERQCLLLAQNLKKNWNPFLIAINDGVLAEKYRSIDIPVFFISRVNRIDFISPTIKLHKLVRKYTPAVLHSWGWMSTYASATISSFADIPQINSMVRMGVVPDNTKPLSKFAVKMGTYSVANSKAGLSAWEVSQNKGIVIYNGFDWLRVDLPPKPSINKNSEIIMIASMSNFKDWDAYISTAKLVTPKDNNITFIGYGDGINRKIILNSASSLLTAKKLFLPGRTLNPIQNCQRADIGILLSTNGEGISNSIMEYMACELPVICTNSGGNPELVEDGVTGFLVDPKNNPDDIADKIIWLINNPDKAKRMGIAGKKKILSEFSTEKMVQEYEKLYNMTLSY